MNINTSNDFVREMKIFDGYFKDFWIYSFKVYNNEDFIKDILIVVYFKRIYSKIFEIAIEDLQIANEDL